MGVDETMNDACAIELNALRLRLADADAELDVLRTSEAELRAMFQAMTDIVLVMNREGRYLKIAPTAPNLLYRPSRELKGKTLHEVMPPAPADAFLSCIREALDSGRVVTMEYSLPIEGVEVFFLGNISPMTKDTVIFVARDISERKRAEQVNEERIRQQEIIRAQEATLMELSTPLIPISDEITVMPVIGQLDKLRIEQLMTTLLGGIQGRRAHVAILDITGVAKLDTYAADALVRVARAAQLLGAQVVLTGIRPEVAQTLVTNQADLQGIVTRGTLQSGIAYAMAGITLATGQW
jgi:rsbT co-antagonist protein RsbR